jgi:hypothetical protein
VDKAAGLGCLVVRNVTGPLLIDDYYKAKFDLFNETIRDLDILIADLPCPFLIAEICFK